MSMQSNNNATRRTPETPPGPGHHPMSPGWIVAVALYLVVLSILILYGLLKVWPYPTPSGEPKQGNQTQTSPVSTGAAGSGATSSQTEAAAPAVEGTAAPSLPARPEGGTAPTAETTAPQNAGTTVSTTPALTPPKKELPDPELIYFFGGRFRANIYLETRLLLLVMLTGALGSLLHALRSLYWYTGNRKMVWSWVAFYLLLPFTGAILAVIFYLVVRGGFFSPQASTETTSPFGFAALSALVGLFSPQATLKLKEIAETIFTKPGSGEDSKTQTTESGTTTTAPTINAISPSSGPAARAEEVSITGTGFANGVVVKFGGLPAVVTSSSGTSIEVRTPESATGPGVVDVEVTNPDGQKVVLAQGYSYVGDNGGE